MIHLKKLKRLLIVIVFMCICVGVLHVVYKSLTDIKLLTRYIGNVSQTDEQVLNLTLPLVISKPVTVTKPFISTALRFTSYVRFFNTSADYSSAKQIHKCVDLKIQSIGNTPICVYDPAIDIYVSKSIIDNGNWEGDLISLVVNIIQGARDTVFLDFGCNVGVYTLAIAKFGRQVSALDANRKNLEMLTTSLQKGNLTKMVTLIWNALSDKAETVGFKEDRKNIGGLQMVGEVSSTSFVSDENSSVAIVLDDLVPIFRNQSVFIKMDIETYELKAMLGGKKFFKEVDVKFLLMEWMHHKISDVGTGIIQFMTKRGYTPFSPLQRSVPLNIEDRQLWSTDIIWVKNSMNGTWSA
ncbi:uncharacterized protein LOC127855580 [Dreissena polymorpha]|nr:uncharacterized protein LOC127855580 [Dreissena polymorpha]